MNSPGRRSGVSSIIPHGVRSGMLPAAVLAALLLLPAAAAGQYRLTAPSGDTLHVSRDSVEAMLARTRALYDTLETDPDIVYYVGYGGIVPEDRHREAYPWNVVTVRSDSAAQVVTPDNLREADRAYFNYAVVRMGERGADARGEESCQAAVAREARLLSAFADGWIVSRTLFGGAEYAPLAEIAFARAADHLEAYAADHGLPTEGDCADRWLGGHPDRVQAYRQWRQTEFLGRSPPPDSTTPAPVHSLRES